MQGLIHGHVPHEGGKSMEPEIEAKCAYDVGRDVWVIQVIVPCGATPSDKIGLISMGLADELLRLAKERMEIEAKQV